MPLVSCVISLPGTSYGSYISVSQSWKFQLLSRSDPAKTKESMLVADVSDVSHHSAFVNVTIRGDGCGDDACFDLTRSMTRRSIE